MTALQGSHGDTEQEQAARWEAEDESRRMERIASITAIPAEQLSQEELATLFGGAWSQKRWPSRDYTDEELSGVIIQTRPALPGPHWHLRNMRKRDYQNGTLEQLLIDGWEPFAVDSGEFYLRKYQ